MDCAGYYYSFGNQTLLLNHQLTLYTTVPFLYYTVFHQGNTAQKETHPLSPAHHRNISPPLLLTSIDLMTTWLYKTRICQHLVRVFNSFSTGLQQAH